jgi:hypothetical protein
MEDKPQNSICDEKEKKKKRPTIQFYQPPNSRNRDTNNKPENRKVLEERLLETIVSSRSPDLLPNSDLTSNKSHSAKPVEKRVRSFKQQSAAAKINNQLPKANTEDLPQIDATHPRLAADRYVPLKIASENICKKNDTPSLSSSEIQIETTKTLNKISGGILKINLQEVDTSNKATERLSVAKIYSILF